ncbi:plasma membrane channel aqy1 [Trichoderma arundinaceum]|uniref:Plasma membrane channel aqy1 n=1 Tax=Trichoderma arundinaceum TaxID=490622 RepID=A0A395NZR2_TRIAR|nr:plasma membrane channel aqy1 [Trichoderma arundinaceum]
MPLHLEVPPVSDPELRRSPSPPPSPSRAALQTYNDKYVVIYDFSDIDYDAATKEFITLLHNLEATGLHVEVRPGYEQTILLFVKAPSELLGNRVYKLRVRDWLYGITQTRPAGNKNTIVPAWYEAEDILSMDHLVSWPQSMGGAGITPGLGQWKNVKAIFPMHNDKVNQALLRRLSKKLFVGIDELDMIRDLFGSKACESGGILLCIWPVIFCLPPLPGAHRPHFLALATQILPHLCDFDGHLVYRISRILEIIVDQYGRTIHYTPKWKQISRQLLQLPFMAIATIALGLMISLVFAVEILISDSYDGPNHFYLEYLPTVLLAVLIPYISSYLERVARWLTDFENHRTADNHEMSLTQKIFVLSIITNYLPILLTAFVYVPFGNQIFPWLEGHIVRFAPSIGNRLTELPFRLDADRLRHEVITLTVTGQLSSFFEENILPLIKYKMSGWYREYRRAYTKDTILISMVTDDGDEAQFLAHRRNEATLDTYNVQDDIAELVLQFGYLALFSPAWPLIPMGFLLNNWVELRSDFAKICIEHRRPAPYRAEGIGPWIVSLEVLVWLGSICSAAIVHLFGSDSLLSGSWSSLPLTIFISEHILLALTSLTRIIFQRFGSEQLRRERSEQYARRLSILEEIEEHKRDGEHIDVRERERRKSLLITGNESFWTKQVEDGASAAAGMKLITLARKWEESNGELKKKQ